MRRLASVLVAVLLLAACSAPTPLAPVPTAPPQPGGVTQSINADVVLDADVQVWSTEFPASIGTFADEAHGWMVADRTRLLSTTDGGRHWSQVAAFDDLVSRIHFISDTRGWVFTDNGVLTTADAGRTWQPAAADSLPRRGQIRDDQFGWEIEQKDGSSPSFLLLTQDGGESWTRQPTPCKLGFQAPAASFLTPETGFLLCSMFQGSGGSSKWLYNTTDGGQNWQLLTGTIYGQKARPEFPPGVLVGPKDPVPEGALPATSHGGTMVFLDADHGIISFHHSGPFVGHIYTTDDGGKTWMPLPILGDPFAGDFRFFTPTFGRILVNDQRQWAWLETQDGGATWQQIYPPLMPLLAHLPALEFQDADHGVAARTLADHTAILTTSNGGRTWQPAPPDTAAPALPASNSTHWPPEVLPGKPESSSFHPGGCGWVIVVGDQLELTLLVSEDTGHNWTRIHTPGIQPTTVTSIDCTTAWLTDNHGHLYRTNDGGRTWHQML